MRAGLDPARLQSEPLAGSVFAVETGVHGLVQPRVKRMPARQSAGAVSQE
jgi:hypothetical protein